LLWESGFSRRDGLVVHNFLGAPNTFEANETRD
jgi:hypothetical protein